jgi:hypothetical protein
MREVPVGQREDALAVLASLDRDALVARWVATFGCPAPRSSQVAFLRAALAWHLQMEQLPGAGSRGVARAIERLRRSTLSLAPAQVLAPGTRLVREWQGRTHHVTVLPQGFEYEQKHYRSLTAIARQITGTPWSGPAFFGLRR